MVRRTSDCNRGQPTSGEIAVPTMGGFVAGRFERWRVNPQEFSWLFPPFPPVHGELLITPLLASDKDRDNVSAIHTIRGLPLGFQDSLPVFSPRPCVSAMVIVVILKVR